MNNKLRKLLDVPEGTAGEIIDGELVTTPVLEWKRHLAAGMRDILLAPYSSKKPGDPGGWRFLLEPKLELGDSILVPNLAGWKEERLPAEREVDLIDVVPDWTCDIISVDTAMLVMNSKLPIYARHGLLHVWVFSYRNYDETFGLLKAYELDRDSGHWIWLGHFWGDEGAKVKPFSEIEFRPKQFVGNLAVMGTKRSSVSKADIIRRIGTALEAGLSRPAQGNEPEDDPTP